MTASSPVSTISRLSCAGSWRARASAPGAWRCGSARTDGSATEIAAGLSAPSHAAAHLVRLLQDKLEDIDMGFGVDLMALAALITEPLHPTQTSLTETGEILAPEVLIDALVNRLGHPRGAPPLSPGEPHSRARAKHARRVCRPANLAG